MEEFGGLAFKGVADELEDPSCNEECEGVDPEPMVEDAGDEDCYRDQNRGNAKRVAGAVDGVLVGGRVLRDPFFAGAVA